ncbi:MAG: peptide-methionine (S)-S-oxide reductase MsrA [Thermomicrobiales bacterium]
MLFDSLFNRKPAALPTVDDALKGRDRVPYSVPETHEVLGTRMHAPFPDGIETAVVGLGCFWGAERLFWEVPGVYSTAVGYSGGVTPNPTYEEVCSGRTGHTEVVLVAFDPANVSYADLLKIFFEAHDPTQGMRQGGDVGTQYRSAIYATTETQRSTAEAMVASYGEALTAKGKNRITTEVVDLGPFYYAEDYHQQYLHKVPNGYCGLAGTGVSCAVPYATLQEQSILAPVSGADHESAVADVGLRPLPSSEAEWKKILGKDQYRVLRESGTERPFTGEYNAVWDDGLYRCGACGNPLFESAEKFDHGCGWPSFSNALPGATEDISDRSHGMVRTEVQCARCHSHLGHVFPDGPQDAGGNRYCMNSLSLAFEEQ